MTAQQASDRLRRMIAQKLNAVEAVHRKRSWTPSEKAMTVADLRMDIDALKIAVKTLEAAK